MQNSYYCFFQFEDSQKTQKFERNQMFKEAFTDKTYFLMETSYRKPFLIKVVEGIIFLTFLRGGGVGWSREKRKRWAKSICEASLREHRFWHVSTVTCTCARKCSVK